MDLLYRVKTLWAALRGNHYTWPAIDITLPGNRHFHLIGSIHMGSHDMFIADVEGVLADTAYIDPETGAFDMEKAGLLVYSHGHYYKTGEAIGNFGWSVKKK